MTTSTQPAPAFSTEPIEDQGWANRPTPSETEEPAATAVDLLPYAFTLTGELHQIARAENRDDLEDLSTEIEAIFEELRPPF